MSFKEFTLVSSEDYCEVMADINVKTGKIVDLYCYADDIPAIEDYETGREYKITTKPGLNPLFVHIDRKSHIYKLLLRNGFIFCTSEENTDDYNEEIALIEKSLAQYDIRGIESIY